MNTAAAEEVEALPKFIKSKIFSSRERQGRIMFSACRSSSAVATLGIAEHAWPFSEGEWRRKVTSTDTAIVDHRHHRGIDRCAT